MGLNLQQNCIIFSDVSIKLKLLIRLYFYINAQSKFLFYSATQPPPPPQICIEFSLFRFIHVLVLFQFSVVFIPFIPSQMVPSACNETHNTVVTLHVNQTAAFLLDCCMFVHFLFFLFDNTLLVLSQGWEIIKIFKKKIQIKSFLL